MKLKISSLLLLLLTAMIWGFAFVAQVDGAAYVEANTLNGVRFVLGAVSLIPLVLIFEKGRSDKRERKKTFLASLLAGGVLFSASTLQQLGIEHTASAGLAGFITGLYTVFIPIVCFFLFKKKTGFNVWLGAFFAIVGLFLLCYKSGEGFSFGKGELLLLLGSFFWTAHVIIIDRFGKTLRPLHFSLGQFSVCGALGIICMFAFETPTLSGILDAKWAILYCGLLSVGVAYTLQVVAQRRCDPTHAAIVLSSESVFSAVGGAIFGTDKISFIGYVGCLCMFLGILISQIEIKLKKRREKNL